MNECPLSMVNLKMDDMEKPDTGFIRNVYNVIIYTYKMKENRFKPAGFIFFPFAPMGKIIHKHTPFQVRHKSVFGLSCTSSP